MSALEKFYSEPDNFDEDLANAMATLITQGIAFVTETGEDGQKEFVIDRVRFRGDEIRRLHQQHALTRDGIRHYLVSR
jgi:hypothetical protein